MNTACADCPRAIALQRQVTDLKDEVAEWERQSKAYLKDEAGRARIGLVCARLRIPPQVARLLLHLLDHAGAIQTRARLYGAISDNEDGDDKIVDVRLVHLRRALAEAGLDVEVTTHWGQGFSLSVDDGQAIVTFLAGESAGLALPPPASPLALPSPLAVEDAADEPADEPVEAQPLTQHEEGVLRSGMSDASAASVLGRSSAWVARRREAQSW